MLLVATLTALLASVPARAERSTFQVYDANQGLASLGGSCMLQDPAGYILVCTEHGVFAYDGRRFFNLGPAQGLRQGGFVYNIALTAQGRIALSYADEVLVSAPSAGALRSPETLSFQAVRHPGLSFYDESPRRLAPWQDGLVVLIGDTTWRVRLPAGGPPVLQAMAYTPKEAALLRGARAVLSVSGHLWETFADNRLCAADPGFVRCYGAAEGLRDGPWSDLMAGPGKQVFARSLNAVATFDAAAGRWTVTNLPDQGGRYLNYKTKLGLFRTPDGTLATQTDHGLAFLRHDGWRNFTVADGAPSGVIVSAITDTTGQLWFQIFGRGLVRWLGYGHWETVQKADGLSEGVPWQSARAPGGPLWVATDTGVDEITAGGGALRVTRVLPGAAFALAMGPRGRLWRSYGDSGALVVDPATGRAAVLDVPPVNVILAAPDDVMWIGTLGGLFRVADHDGAPLRPQLEGGPHVPVTSAVADGTGRIYYIASGHLRCRRPDGTDDAVQGTWPGGGFEPLALAMGGAHDIWVGGAGGLYRLVMAGGRIASFELIPTADTRTNSIAAIMVDHRGWVWAGTALGVSVFDGQRWVTVDADAGLASDDVDQLGIREDPDGSVWIVTSQGLSHLLDPAWLFEDHPLTAFISSEEVGGRPVLGRALPYTEDAMTLQFGTANYGSEHSVSFRYRLSGVDADWAVSPSGLVRYAFVPPGRHVLEVVAYDQLTHRASPPATLAMEVGYPWWRRWWSEALWMLCAAGLVYGILRLRFAAMVARQAKLRRLVDTATAQLQYQAAHDSLTGLLNRSAIEKRLASKLSEATVDQILVALIDIDHFKSVNDEYGHLGGDDVLRRIGTLVSGLMRDNEWAGRYGGEEILLVLEDSDRSGVDRVLGLHAAIRSASTRTAAGHTIHITCSIGLACAVRGDDWESLIGRADDALYEAKASGRDKVVESRQRGGGRPTDPDGRRHPDRRTRTSVAAFGLESRARSSALTMDLRNVDPDREMELFYQPIVNIQRGGAAHDPSAAQVVGYEALLRWNHPTRGLIMPQEFVRLSEDNGSIDRLGAWILKRACTDAARWPSGLAVAINVSPMQFRSGELIERVRDALEESGIQAGRVELEVTETTMLLDDDSALFTLRQLRALGVKIALDDFGTGFSSMSYLRWFPFDRIKIDRSFVADICQHEAAATITRSILALGRSLNMPVTAEGVETPEQVAMLRAEGCTHAQGYLFGRPEPKAKVHFAVSAGD